MLNAIMLLFVLLNPFLMSVYLISLMRDLHGRVFVRVMLRAHIISAITFAMFALTGDRIFKEVFQVRFAAFLIFGGMVFLLIGIRAIFSGQLVLFETRGNPEHLAGSVAMPFMIGPGTISASVLIGSNLPLTQALSAVFIAIVASLVSISAFKYFHDKLQQHNERLLNRYVEIAGRVVALFTGSFAVDMIARGLEMLWREAVGLPL